MLYVLENAEAYKTGRIERFEEVGVEAVDERTLRFRLVGPTPHFLSMLKHYSWYPVHPETVEAHGGILDMSGAWTQEGNFVGNGAFVMTEWRPDQYIRVSASPTYWDRERMELEEIYFFPITDANTEKRMSDSGR